LLTGVAGHSAELLSALGLMQLMLWVRVLGIYTQYYFQNESHESQSKQQDKIVIRVKRYGVYFHILNG